MKTPDKPLVWYYTALNFKESGNDARYARIREF